MQHHDKHNFIRRGGHIVEPEIREGIKKSYQIAMFTDPFARMVAFAISQTGHIDIDKILFRPTLQEL